MTTDDIIMKIVEEQLKATRKETDDRIQRRLIISKELERFL